MDIVRPKIIVTLLALAFSCSESKINRKLIHFEEDTAISNLHGFTNDSLTFFFPENLFKDTLRYIICTDDTFEISYHENFDTFINQWKLRRESIVRTDSIKIKDVSFLARMTSFALFKMHEPILYNFPLTCEVYRLIVDRSFSKFFVFTIEKNRDSIYIVTKGLNRHVLYPFMVYAKPDVFYTPPNRKVPTKIEKDRFEAKQDSMIRILNNTNYYIDSTICRRLSLNQWDTLSIILKKAQFWESYPHTCGGCIQIDGSRWIIEGQNKYGYQIKEVLNPFSCNYEQKDIHADIFKYIISLSGIDTSRFSFY